MTENKTEENEVLSIAKKLKIEINEELKEEDMIKELLSKIEKIIKKYFESEEKLKELTKKYKTAEEYKNIKEEIKLLRIEVKESGEYIINIPYKSGGIIRIRKRQPIWNRDGIYRYNIL